MNVFIVDMEPEIAASALCDTHLKSQLKEAAQILCTVATLRKVPAAGLYLPTHAGAPLRQDSRSRHQVRPMD